MIEGETETADFSFTVDLRGVRPYKCPALRAELRRLRRLARDRERSSPVVARSPARAPRARSTRPRRTARSRAGADDGAPPPALPRRPATAEVVEIAGPLLATSREALADAVADLLADLILAGSFHPGGP